MLAAEEGGSNVLRIPMFEFVIGLVAFFIVFGVLAKVALPKIKQTLEERADAIEGGIKRAEEAQAEAQRTLEQYQEQMAAARAEVAEIRQQAEAERATVMEEARKAAEAQAQQIAANATAQIARYACRNCPASRHRWRWATRSWASRSMALMPRACCAICAAATMKSSAR